MKQIIENVLEDLTNGQLNFESKTARELIMEEAERCNKSIFAKIKCKTGEYIRFAK